MYLVFPDVATIADFVADALASQVRARPGSVLGLATGGTMEPVYARFLERVRQTRLDVSRLRSFNLDEYIGLTPDHPQSYAAYMKHHLFDVLGFDPLRHHLPDGCAPDEDGYCRHYSSAIYQAGGIDLQLLGVGRNGHIGFNEPGTAFDSMTHVVSLDERTRIDNSRFFAEGELVPGRAITMGLRDIMSAREILLVATGAAKAPTLAAFHRSRVTPELPFSVLKQHPRVRIVLDAEAAQLLPEQACQPMLQTVPPARSA